MTVTNDVRRSPGRNATLTTPTSRIDGSTTSAGTIVVAVDGSLESLAALHWAVDHAASTDSTLKIVTAFPHPLTEAEFPPRYVDVYGVAARERALVVIESVLGHRDVDHVVAAGTIEHVLMEHAAGASTIVIGTRARRRFWHRYRRSLTNRIAGRVDSTVISVPYHDPVRGG